MKQHNSNRFNFLINSFPYACSIAKIINKFTETSNSNHIRVLQVNSYPGIFAKNLFIALEEQKIAYQIDHILHEKSNANLEDIESKNFHMPSAINYELSNESISTLLPSQHIQIAIINNFLASDSKQELDCLLKELLSNKNLKMIIGCEALKCKLDPLNANTNFKIWEHSSDNLFHYAYIHASAEDLISCFDLEFNKNNDYEKYLDLVKVLNKISCPQGYESSKAILNELLKLDGYSANTHVLIAKFLKLMGNPSGAQEHLNKAKILDTYKLLSIH
jgi:hypothetical protein